MVASQILSRLESVRDLRPVEPFPELKDIEKLNYVRQIWGVPFKIVKQITPEEAFERGRQYMSARLGHEIKLIKEDIQKGL